MILNLIQRRSKSQSLMKKEKWKLFTIKKLKKMNKMTLKAVTQKEMNQVLKQE